jgi:hypothetical protein
MLKADAAMESIGRQWRNHFGPVVSPDEGDRRVTMTALFGAAVLGLVPLPSMAARDARAGRAGYWPTPSDNAGRAHPARLSRAIIERMATREELARLRRELWSIGAGATAGGLRRARLKMRRTGS